jgi:hypothetical protein
MMARILVFTPTYDNLLQKETVKSIKAMQFDGQLDWVVSDENPYPGRDMRNCVFQFQKGRQLALDGGYDAILMVEHDMVVPVDAAQKLWNTNAGVVYGCYQLRHNMRAVNLFQHMGTRNIGMSLSLYPRELQEARRRGWTEVSGAGFGCLLIRREMLVQVPFRDTGNAPDLPFAQDCEKAGIMQIGRCDVVCGHIDVERGVTLWPFGKDGGMLARVLAQQDVNVNDAGKAVAMVKNRYYSINLDTALELQRAGYVRITNEADTVEVATSTGAESRETAAHMTGTRKRKQ